MQHLLPLEMRAQFSRLRTPSQVQDFLNSFQFNFEQDGETITSPMYSLKTQKLHCLEGALLAASIFKFHGRRPLLLDLKAKRPDDDHVVALYKEGGHWGAVSKTNHAVLRFRDPIYKTIRQLVLSYFHEYFDNATGRKNLYSYSSPVNLDILGKSDWETADSDLWYIPRLLNNAKHFSLVPKGLKLRAADPVERKAGSVVEWHPSRKKLNLKKRA